MLNEALAKIFFEIADILEMQNVAWKPRAYRTAAINLQNIPEPVELIYKRGGEKALEAIPGVGKALAQKIIEFIETGAVESLAKLRKKSGVDIASLNRVPGLGPRKIKILFEKLGVKDIESLKKAAEQHKISGLEGFGEKSEAQILKNIAIAESGGRIPLAEAIATAKTFKSAMQKSRAVKRIEIAGSVRRMKPTIGDVDVLVSTTKPKKVMDLFTSLKPVSEVIMKGSTKSSIRTGEGIQVDLRAVKPEQWGAALLYFTGSKQFNISIRRIAIKKGLKLNEYGLFRGEEVVAGKTEEEVFKALGMKFVEPQKREVRG